MMCGRRTLTPNPSGPRTAAGRTKLPSPLGGEGVGMRGCDRCTLTPSPSPPRGEGNLVALRAKFGRGSVAALRAQRGWAA